MDQAPKIEPGSTIRVVSDPAPMLPVASRPSRWPLVVAGLGLLTGLAGLGTALWVASEARSDSLRLSTEIAQLRVSLDLYARNSANAAPSNVEELAAIEERLTALETLPSNATTLPPLPTGETTAPAATASVQGEDCLPSGMRLLVAMGDSYDICGQDATVEVGMVDNGYITLRDGTTIPSGGSMPLGGSACTIAVTSSGDEGLTGYAEIRVSC